MNQAMILLMFRLVSGLLLLAFVGGIAWLIYRDMRVTAVSLESAQRPSGNLRVVANDDGNPAVDTLFPLYPVTSIGRANSNTVVLPDGFASAEHALVIRREGQWWLQDQGSRNGTLLNGVTVGETAVVSPGDIIAIGGTQLKLEMVSSQKANHFRIKKQQLTFYSLH
ncbi:MAG: FHA domain-containing protein [Chloroflexi bacterium]|nr:FHA domain-containing protein [Chloroflexota bacterium]